MSKKSEQLGMDPSLASYRLVKDLLFDFIIKAGHKCYRCDNELTRETFSIDHKIVWLDSDSPIGLYFDLKNIKFSHKLCNSLAARRVFAKCGTVHRYDVHGCRCIRCTAAKRNIVKKYRKQLKDRGLKRTA